MSENDKVADSGASDKEVADKSVDQSQEAGAKVAGDQPVDLSNHPQFRKMQSEYQARIARAEKSNQELAAQVEELATRGLDGEELSEYQQKQLEKALHARDEELNALRSQLARQDGLQAIAVEAEVPLSAIQDANTPDEAWRMALLYTKKNGAASAKKKAQAEQAKAENNSVVVGGGKSASSMDDWEKSIQKAFDEGRTVDYVRLLNNKPSD